MTDNNKFTVSLNAKDLKAHLARILYFGAIAKSKDFRVISCVLFRFTPDSFEIFSTNGLIAYRVFWTGEGEMYNTKKDFLISKKDIKRLLVILTALGEKCESVKFEAVGSKVRFICNGLELIKTNSVDGTYPDYRKALLLNDKAKISLYKYALTTRDESGNKLKEAIIKTSKGYVEFDQNYIQPFLLLNKSFTIRFSDHEHAFEFNGTGDYQYYVMPFRK